MFSLSLHELTACVYYKLAIERGLRGSNPDSELLAHAPRTRRSRAAYTNNVNIGSKDSRGHHDPNLNASASAAPSQPPQQQQEQQQQHDAREDSTSNGGDYECKNASDADVRLAIRYVLRIE